MQLGGVPAPNLDPRPHFELMRRAALRALRSAGHEEGFLSVTLLGDDAIAALNLTHLGHSDPTDSLSFRLAGPTGELEADVYVGHEFAARVAAEEGIAWEEELVRLTVHGTLHALGRDHPPGPDRVSSPMWSEQESIVREVLTS